MITKCLLCTTEFDAGEDEWVCSQCETKNNDYWKLRCEAAEKLLNFMFEDRDDECCGFDEFSKLYNVWQSAIKEKARII